MPGCFLNDMISNEFIHGNKNVTSSLHTLEKNIVAMNAGQVNK